MRVLVGHTGFVGSIIKAQTNFDLYINSANSHLLRGLNADLIVCAGLPATKWLANSDPAADWKNMTSLAANLQHSAAESAVLISTIDVYQPPIGVDEETKITLDGPEAYGSHRAWFETFFHAHFKESLTLRLPGLFAPTLKKNLIFDLMNDRQDQLEKCSSDARFQFFDATKTWELVNLALEKSLKILNVASEPVFAGEIAAIFGKKLNSQPSSVHYQMLSRHSSIVDRSGPYLFSKGEVLDSISRLRKPLP